MIRARHTAGWSSATRAYLAHVQAVLESMREFWPLTLRQLYYRLVGANVIANNLGEYKKLSRVLSKARLQYLVEPEAIEDRSRSITEWQLYPTAEDFVDESKKGFLTGYNRDLLQTQPVAWEVWVEKDALSNLCKRVAAKYGLPVIVAKGYSSVSFLFELKARIGRESLENDRPSGIIYLGDFDPSGMNMLPSMVHTLTAEMRVPARMLETVRCALNPEHVDEYNLPNSPDAVKEHDRRAKEFIEQYGEIAVELDALEPGTLMDLLDNCIKDNLDLARFDEQVELNNKEIERLADMRERALEAIGNSQ